LVTLATLQLSLTVGLPSVTPVAAHAPLSAFTVTKTGHVRVGSGRKMSFFKFSFSGLFHCRSICY
jgi:hypothetical protein